MALGEKAASHGESVVTRILTGPDNADHSLGHVWQRVVSATIPGASLPETLVTCSVRLPFQVYKTAHSCGVLLQNCRQSKPT